MSSLLRRVRFSGGDKSRGNEREWLDGDGAFLFGKHEGETVARVRRDDPGYLRWVVENVENICGEDREIIEAALRRRG